MSVYMQLQKEKFERNTRRYQKACQHLAKALDRGYKIVDSCVWMHQTEFKVKTENGKIENYVVYESGKVEAA